VSGSPEVPEWVAKIVAEFAAREGIDADQVVRLLIIQGALAYEKAYREQGGPDDDLAPPTLGAQHALTQAEHTKETACWDLCVATITRLIEDLQSKQRKVREQAVWDYEHHGADLFIDQLPLGDDARDRVHRMLADLCSRARLRP
jgi:hypothetical protein